MSLIPWQAAKRLLIVDPRTGWQVPFVTGADPENGVLNLYTTTPAPIPMIVIENGVTTERPFTLVVVRDPQTGAREYLQWSCHCGFDVIDKTTGEVIHEVPGLPVPQRAADPEAYWAEMGCRTQKV